MLHTEPRRTGKAPSCSGYRNTGRSGNNATAGHVVFVRGADVYVLTDQHRCYSAQASPPLSTGHASRWSMRCCPLMTGN